jgi:hypothetical protein
MNHATNKNKIMKNIRKNLSYFEKVINVSFSQDIENENSYYVNVIGEYKTDLNNVLSDLKYMNIESICEIDDFSWYLNNKLDER